MAENNRRYPLNLQGILRFCTENTKEEDATGPSTFGPMSDENRKWLEEALAGMQGVDPVKLMLEDIKILINDGENGIERRQDALEDLQMHCEDIDLANDFHKIGGLHMLLTLLRSEHEGLRSGAAELVGTLTQNNPYCQKEVLEIGLLPILLQKLDDSSETELVRIKSLFAISCLVRESVDAQDVFVKCDGFSVLLRAMQTDIEKLQTKSAFMMAALCEEQAKFKDMLCTMGLVEQIVGLLHREHCLFHEHLMRALCNIVTDCDKAREECLRPELQLRQLLQQRHHLLKGKSEFQEELDHVSRLEKICFADSASETSIADR